MMKLIFSIFIAILALILINIIAPVQSNNHSHNHSQNISEKGLEVYSSPSTQYLPYFLKDGVKEFHLTASHFYWKISDEKAIEVYGFNNQIPGPIIRANKGDRIRIVVKNDLPENLTVHWHGLNVPNKMDGVPFITQEPIKPGESFVYEFDLNQSGTYIYHTHHKVRDLIDMGLSGPIIIDDPDKKTMYDLEYLIFLDDWSIDENGNNLALRDEGNRNYNYWTINGKIFPYTPVFKVFSGDRVLFRIINIGNSNVPLHFHGPHFRVIEMQGTSVENLNLTLDTIDLAPAYRYAIEIKAENPGDWMIHSHNVHQASKGLMAVYSYPQGERPLAEYAKHIH
jgi:FtsP/CotA-like multicopper oxidase with cupredoxin domain